MTSFLLGSLPTLPCEYQPTFNHLTIEALLQGPPTDLVSAPYTFLMGTVGMSFPANLLLLFLTLGLTSRVGEHQSWDVASNHSQAGKHSTGQEAKLTERKEQHGIKYTAIMTKADLVRMQRGVFIFSHI